MSQGFYLWPTFLCTEILGRMNPLHGYKLQTLSHAPHFAPYIQGGHGWLPPPPPCTSDKLCDHWSKESSLQVGYRWGGQQLREVADVSIVVLARIFQTFDWRKYQWMNLCCLVFDSRGGGGAYVHLSYELKGGGAYLIVRCWVQGIYAT